MPKKVITVESSAALNKAAYRFTFHGPPKAGKSLLAATASEHFNGVFETDKGPTELPDMFWWAYDAGALRSLERFGLVVPQAINFATVSGADIFAAHREAMKLVYESIEKGLTKWLVCDTVSALDSKWKTYFRDKTTESASKFALYDAMLAAHNKYFEMLNTLPCHIIFLSHSKAQLHDDEGMQKKNKASSMGGDIKLAVTGQAADEYRRHADLIASVRKIYDRKNRTFKHVFYPEVSSDFEGGNRLGLEGEQPANLHSILYK